MHEPARYEVLKRSYALCLLTYYITYGTKAGLIRDLPFYVEVGLRPTRSCLPRVDEYQIIGNTEVHTLVSKEHVPIEL